MSDELLRLPQVLARCGISRTTVFQLIAAGKFPRPRRLRDARVSVWSAADVSAWIANQLND
ncbi:MAG: AlpA family phage regulatory protein [Planctomycetaceae bacterium]|nr:AlpA family phage regulatory protein [Planctomycetaceae bacterium]